MKIRILILAVVLSLNLARGAGLIWPANQLLPTFSTPASVLDCIDVSSVSNPEMDLFASLEGIVNRTQPRIVCTSSTDGEGEFTWLNLHNLPYNLINGYTAILKYQTNVTGLVVTDPSAPDTLNLATTMAGVNNELICDPSLLATLTNSPYNLPITHDLRGKFSNKYQVYGYLYTNYWPLCSHRVFAGLETNLDGLLRDYLVAVKSATVWLDPGNSQDAALMNQFFSSITPVNAVYIGWWPSEANGLGWIASYGVPVLASDYLRNASVFGGVNRPINVPDIPAPPPLKNKVYVALILSDGDNAQYMQHAMKINWENRARGSVPISWTIDPLVSVVDPGMLSYYWSTVSSNDCLISGPSGAGYAHLENWNTANLVTFANASDAYLQRSGVRTITIWDQVNAGIAQAFATNCPTLLGLLDQSGSYNAVNLGLLTIGLTPTYASLSNQVTSAITSASAGWTGNAPLFIAAQAVAWNLVPSDLLNIENSFNTNEYQFVRADHLFLLYQQARGLPQAMTQMATKITASSATLRGVITPNATNTLAWLEWGTNASYGTKSSVTNLGTSIGVVGTSLTGLLPQQIYHFRVVASNAFGLAWGADNQFTTGRRVEAWGSSVYGVTNLPAGLTNVIRIAAGANHALALRNDGTVVAWGNNGNGQTNVPAGLTNVIDISAGILHSLALQSNGTVVAWGGNTFGQATVPAGLTNVVAIAAGGYHNLALNANGTVTAWGYNIYQQTNVPAGLSNVVSVAAGYGHSMALQANGTVSAWGLPAFGLTNVPFGLSNVVAITAGEYHSVALKASGSSLPNVVPVSRWVADTLSGASGSSISNWVDIIGGKSAAQTASGNQPQLYTGVLNGHNTLRFSSSASQYLTVAVANSPMAGATDFTLVMVFKTSTPGTNSSSFFLDTGLVGAEQSGVVSDWALCLNGPELGAGLGAGGGSCNSDVSLYGGNVTDGNPHIAAYMRTGDTIRLYVDGVIVAEQTALCPAPRGNYPFQIGTLTTTAGFFTGDIAEVQVYNQALNPTEMGILNRTLANTYGFSGIAGALVNRWVADNLTGNNGSPINNWVDNIGGSSATQSGTGNQPTLSTNVINGHSTVHFSGSSQYLTVAATNNFLSGAGSFTIAMVFKTSTAGSSSSFFYLNTGLLGAEQSGIVDDWAFCINGSQLGAGLGAGSNSCSADFSLYGGSVTDGNPHIGIYERAGDTINLYVDGILVASQNALCTDGRLNCPFQIGAMTTSGYFFNGDIAEIQIYNRALNAAELINLNAALAATYGVGGVASATVVWGSNSNGQTNTPAGLTNVVAVASGSDSAFNLAVTAEGTAIGWGYNAQGQTNVPVTLTNVVEMAAGSTFSLAIGNETPIVTNITLTGYENHDLTVTLPTVNSGGDSFTMYVASLPALGTLYQYSAGVRGTVISLPNTQVTDSAGRVIFAPMSSGLGSPYTSFNFTASDGFNNSGIAQATINITTPAVPQFVNASWSSGTSGAESFNLNFSGAANATYSVWAGTNLFNWIDLGTATEIQPGVYQYVDTSVTNQPQRFYRLSVP